MHIDRKPYSVITVIERIYHPIAQNMGISLLLRNEISAEVQFPPNSFINLIQITGNLVANALKIASPNGLVDVVFTMVANEKHTLLNMTVTNTGQSVSPELVSAFNKGEKVEKLMETYDEPEFGFRLDYVMQLVSKERGRILIKKGNTSGTTFLLSIPLPEEYLNRRNSFYPIVKNSEVLYNGY